MKNGFKLIVCIVLLLSVSLIGIGYAAVAEDMSITGEALSTPPETLFITEVVSQGSGAVSNSFARTLHNSTVTLERSSSKESFTITIYNNTGYTYYFDKMVWSDDAYDNTNIVPTLSGLTAKQELKHGESVTFTVTFGFKNNTQTSNKVLNSVINYQFVPNKDDAGDIAVKNVLDKFEEILNDDSAGGTFEYLIENMNESSRRANETYIGNVVGADSLDTVAVEDLFTDEIMNWLVLEIGEGQTKDVTAIIKREPLDGNSSTGTDVYNNNGTVKTAGCEMTIYLTPDDIPSNNLIFGMGGKSITVYAAVFSTDENGNWHLISPLYVGTATTNNYDGASFGKTNSFNTDTWKSNAGTYTLEDGTKITVSANQTIQTLVGQLP